MGTQVMFNKTSLPATGLSRSHGDLFITWRRIERSDGNCYLWAWVECASASARRKASKSAQMRAAVLLSRVLMTGSSPFDE